ncbi:hypothetical protein [Geobacter sp. SVR]|uniref:hypothetical protein n=1 Tax=Geobacter sp. SVR TaxID=2495594 RepID=UPI00143F01E9|nr:hypothetical protein [Geobacter sp. SVR]BCS54764.1 hypothetical protein GSVR_30720 [Geobacter sp. SVR]GCF86428.1 hypothetical protein GSbR_30280 [Geobacter sp. SVR]
MQMAKATKKDMEVIASLAALLNSVNRGSFPPGEDGEYLESDPEDFDEDDPEHHKVFYDRIMGMLGRNPGTVNRVVLGFHTLMHNNLVDPGKDHLALHPDLIRAKEVLAATETAIRDYHFALDSREHGGVAQDKAIKTIEDALNLPWRQGEELERRKAL